MKLHPITFEDKPRSVYCGPAAISIITGCTFETARAALNRTRNREENVGVLGTHLPEMNAALKRLGYALLDDKRYPAGIQPTLAAWLRARKGDEMKTLYLVGTTGHWCVVKGRKFCDNHTVEPVFIKSAPRRRARVRSVYRVAPIEGVAPVVATKRARNAIAQCSTCAHCRHVVDAPSSPVQMASVTYLCEVREFVVRARYHCQRFQSRKVRR